MADRYWVGGSGTWSSTSNWSASSGGPSGASAPTINDNVFFDKAGTYTVTVTTSTTASCANLTASNGTVNITSTTSIFNVAGNFDLTGSSGGSFFSGFTTINLGPTSGSGSFTINCAGRNFSTGGNAQTRNTSPDSTYTLLSDFSMSGTASSFTHLNDTLDLNGYTLTTGSFVTTGTVSRTIAFGSTGKITTFGSSSFSSTSTGISVTGNPTVNITFATSATLSPNVQFLCNFIAGGAGNWVLSYTPSSSGLLNLDLSGFVGTWTRSTTSAAFTVYGNVTLGGTLSAATGIMTLGATSGTQTITSNGKTIDWPVTINCPGATVQLADALTLGSTRALVLSGGTFDGTNKTISGASSFTSNGTVTAQNINTSLSFTLTGGTLTQGAANSFGAFTFTSGTLNLVSYQLNATTFASSNSNSRTIAFGTGNVSLTGSGAIWNTFTATNFSATGSKTVNVNYSGATASSIAPGPLSEANSLNFNVTAGSYAITTFNAATNYFGSLNFQGFTGTAPTVGAASLIYGDLTLGTTITSFGTTGTTVTFATTGTQLITTNGKTFNSKIIINGVGGTMRLADALTQVSTVDFAIVNGTLDLNGKTLTVGAVNNGFATYLTGTRSILFNGGTLVCPYAGANAFANNQPAGFTTAAGTGTGKISFTAATAKAMLGGGATYNCTISNDGAGALTIASDNVIDTVTTTSGNIAITGNNTITTLTNAVQPVTFTFTAGTTQTIANWSVNGTSGNLVTIQSATAANHTLSKSSGIVSADYLSISRSTATGGATWYAGANSTNGGNNTGWIFTGPPAGNTGAFFFMF